jgi:DNA modification methylase
MRRPIVNHTKRGELVYDRFLGSGTTLIAADQTGRVCYGLELDPKYVDVIIERWQGLSGKQATLAGSGLSFQQVQALRRRQKVENDGPPVGAGSNNGIEHAEW